MGLTMTKKEKEQRQIEAVTTVLFAGMLFLLMLLAGAGFEHLAGRQDTIFDRLRTASVNSQIKRQGYIKDYADSGYMAYGVEPVGYLLDGFIVEQDFTVTDEMLAYDKLALGIEVATYGRKNQVNLYVELYQDNGFGKAYKIDCSRLKDNKDVDITFETDGLQADVCHVKIYSDAVSGNQAVTMYTTQNCVLAQDMKVAGAQKDANLVMRVFTPHDAGAE